MLSISKLCSAFVGVAIVAAGPAHALCIMGVGNDCPISDSEAASLLKPRIDGKTDGLYSLPLKVAGTSVWWSQASARENPQALNIAREQVRNSIQFILRDSPCSNFLERPGGPPLTQQCEWGRFLAKSGFFTLEIREWMFVSPSINLDIVAKPTENGELRMKGFVRSRQEGGINLHPTINLATHGLRFLRIVRSRTESAGGQSATLVEYEYERVPNVWAHIEKKVPEGRLGTDRRVGSAVFQKWSDGWRLMAMPGI